MLLPVPQISLMHDSLEQKWLLSKMSVRGQDRIQTDENGIPSKLSCQLSMSLVVTKVRYD